ncbi:MAG TPA: barstar family protein [Luteimonas sp.]|nr:barstar family protein [Luteimonas sp.]HRO28003.1 barstar family protein [Luteimonas sp.]HRP71016.1 barstar family protein [Luteimonas sp.]
MSESGFDSGLFDPQQAGVHAVADSDLPLLDLAARDAGLRVAWIDLQHCTGKPMLLLRMAMALDFPEGSGRNWDALADLLRDLSWLDAPHGHALLLGTAQDLREAAPDDFDILLSILQDAAEFHAEGEVPFWAFIGLPEDELDAAPEQDDDAF